MKYFRFWGTIDIGMNKREKCQRFLLEIVSVFFLYAPAKNRRLTWIIIPKC